VSEITAELRLSHGSILSIIHEHLGMSKVSARWVPRNLSAQERHQRVESSRELLDIYNADPENFRARLLTRDETWLDHWDPESKQEAMQWVYRGSPPPNKFRPQPSAGKIMASIFWDAGGVLLVECLPRGATVTGEYYSNLLLKLCQTIKEKRRGKLPKGVLLLHDNAPVHKARIAQAPPIAPTLPQVTIISFDIQSLIFVEHAFK
jgi:histone-lysine N-methyltransferase SETMAR